MSLEYKYIEFYYHLDCPDVMMVIFKTKQFYLDLAVERVYKQL